MKLHSKFLAVPALVLSVVVLSACNSQPAEDVTPLDETTEVMEVEVMDGDEVFVEDTGEEMMYLDETGTDAGGDSGTEPSTRL